jgi:HNH endonuclease
LAISQALRQQLSERAKRRCEYCLLHEDYSAKKHEPDHIIPIKHGGQDILDNLAWACFQCNRYKGSEVAAFEQETGELTPLFNPRQHDWKEHFAIESGLIMPKTAIGRVTELVLQLNRPGRVQVRIRLSKASLYP